MRLFTAIELNEEVRATLAVEQKRLASCLSGARHSLVLVPAERLHVTLVFIGEVDEPLAAAIVEVMNAPVEQAAFRLAFGGAGVFPSRGAPRILWIGTVDGASQVVALYRSVTDRLGALGVRSEERAFHPHVTIGRWREGRPSDARAFSREAVRVLAAMDVAAVTLYVSRLSPTGPSYTALAHSPLRGTGELPSRH